jgi:hypothetical protein
MHCRLLCTEEFAQTPGVNLVAEAKALFTAGSARWSVKFCTGPFPVTMACRDRIRRVGEGSKLTGGKG